MPNWAISYRLTKTKIPRMYGQPKVHKQGNPLREIVDSTGSAAKETDRFISKIIKQYVGKSEYYVKNSAHFAEMTKDLRVEEDEILVSYDVTTLYPSVPHLSPAHDQRRQPGQQNINISRKHNSFIQNLCTYHLFRLQQKTLPTNRRTGDRSIFLWLCCGAVHGKVGKESSHNIHITTVILEKIHGRHFCETENDVCCLWTHS